MGNDYDGWSDADWTNEHLGHIARQLERLADVGERLATAMGAVPLPAEPEPAPDPPYVPAWERRLTAWLKATDDAPLDLRGEQVPERVQHLLRHGLSEVVPRTPPDTAWMSQEEVGRV